MPKKRKKNNKKPKGFWNRFKRLLEQQSAKQIILKFILTVILIPIVYWVVSELHDKYKQRSILEQRVEIVDKSFETGDYERALEEYKEIINSFDKNQHSALFTDLLSKIGRTLILSDFENTAKLKESLKYLNNANQVLTIGSEQFNYNSLKIIDAYFQLYYLEGLEYYLDNIKTTLDKIKPTNEILMGLKYLYQERLYLELFRLNNEAKDIHVALKCNDNARAIFTQNNNMELSSLLANDRGNIEMEFYHLNNESNHLEAAKSSYLLNAENMEVDDISRSIGRFGLGHYYKHKFEIDSIYSHLSQGKEYLKKTLQVYDSIEYPSYYYSSKAMLAQIEKKIYDFNSDTGVLISSINNFEEGLRYYKYDFRPREFFENSFQLGQNYYLLAIENKSIDQLIKAKTHLEASKEHFNFNDYKATNAIIQSTLAHIYKILYETGSIEEMLKILEDSRRKGLENITINADNLGPNDIYYEKFRKIIVPPERIMNQSLSKAEYQMLAEKYYLYNWEFSKLVNDVHYQYNAALYKTLEDVSSRPETIELISTFIELGPYAIMMFEDQGNMKRIELTEPTLEIGDWN